MAKIIPGASAQAVKKKQYLVLGLIAAAVVVVALVAGYLTDANKKPGLPVADATKPVLKNIALPGENLKEEQSWRAIEGARLEALAKDVTSLRAENDAMRKELTSRGSALPAGVVPPPQRIAEQPPPVAPSTAVPQQMPQLPPPPSRQALPPPPGTLPDPLGSAPRPAIATVSFEEDPGPSSQAGAAAGRARPAGTRTAQRAEATASSAPHNPETYLPAGTFFSGVLLSGLDAPTGGQAQQNPQPVLIQITGNAFLPNKLRAEVRGCFLTAYAHGDLSSSRALIRGDRIACTLDDGGAIDVPIKTFVVGPDGKVGVAGTTVSKAGKLLANAAISGLLSGLAAVAQSYATVNSVSPLGSVQTIDTNKIPQYAAASGIQSAADKLAAYYMKMSDATLPVIEIPTGVAVDVVLQRGLSLDTNSR